MVLTSAYVSVVMANERDESQNIVKSSPPASGPSNYKKTHKAESPNNVRKIGNHQESKTMTKEYFSESPALSPTISYQDQEKKHYYNSKGNAISTSTDHLKPVTEVDVNIQVEKIHQKRPHHSIDRSVVGGGVILGGLATTFLVSVFCYIKATGKHKTKSPGTSASSSPTSNVNV